VRHLADRGAHSGGMTAGWRDRRSPTGESQGRDRARTAPHGTPHAGPGGATPRADRDDEGEKGASAPVGVVTRTYEMGRASRSFSLAVRGLGRHRVDKCGSPNDGR